MRARNQETSEYSANYIRCYQTDEQSTEVSHGAPIQDIPQVHPPLGSICEYGMKAVISWFICYCRQGKLECPALIFAELQTQEAYNEKAYQFLQRILHI